MVRLDELNYPGRYLYIPSLERSYHVISLLLKHCRVAGRRITTSWSNTCTGDRSVSNVSLVPSGTSRLLGELFWSATSLESVVDPSENPLLQTFFSLGLRLLPERFCWLPRVWRLEWELKLQEIQVFVRTPPYSFSFVPLYFFSFGFQFFPFRIVCFCPGNIDNIELSDCPSSTDFSPPTWT